MRGSQRPGLLHLPDGSDVDSGDALYLLGEWGFDYDDWQSFSMRCALLEQPDGRWAAKEFGLEISRQNGKGELIEGREALGLFYFDERKLIHSAHEFATASEALDRMDDRIGQNPSLKQRVKSVKRSHGEEGVYLRDGRKLLYKTRTKGGGRGFGADYLALDEAMFLPEAFLGALMPVISARPNPQMWLTGSEVDRLTMADGVVFARLRQRALSGAPGRMAYLGWSPTYSRPEWNTPEDVPREAKSDPRVIAEANPALGIRIDLEHVVDTELPAMDHRTFCVERLGVGDWPDADDDPEGAITAEMWDACRDELSSVADPVRFAFDVRPDRRFAAISVAGTRRDGLFHVEVVDHRPGVGWVTDRLAELMARHRTAGPVMVARSSPAAALIPGIEEAGVSLEPVDAPGYAQACGVFFDVVEQRTLRHLGTSELTAAARGAAQRTVGDAWAWSRKNSAADISPLVAGTLALWGALQKLKPSAVVMY